MTTNTLTNVSTASFANIDIECESVHSDYSEFGPPLRDIDLEGTAPRLGWRRSPTPSDGTAESEEEYAKRMNKINILSLAQEFAELKQLDRNILPFDLHKAFEDIGFDESDSLNTTDTDSVISPDSSDTISGSHNESFTIESTNNTREINDSLIEATPEECRTTDVNVRVRHNPHNNMSLDISNSSEIHVPSPTTIQTTNDLLLSWNFPRENTLTTAVNCKNQLEECNDKLPKNSDSHIPANYVDADSVESLGIVSKSPHSDMNHNCSNGCGTECKIHSDDITSQNSQVTHSASPADMPKNFARISKDALPPKNYDAVLTGQDFDVYNIETALPEMDWTLLESRIQQASDVEKHHSETRNNNREEIRRKLAMGSDDDLLLNQSLYIRKPSLQTRLYGAKSLQICFMNDMDDDITPSDPELSADESQKSALQMNGSIPTKVLANETNSFKPHPPVNQSDSFLQQQAVMQEEAKMALAQAGNMAKMQLEVEKESTKRPPIAEKVGIPGTLVDDRHQKLTWRVLQMMNIAQIQIAVNDLHTQIEALNDDLVRLLIERDDLHMEQDSMLVDIEDHTRRAKELSERLKINQKQKKQTRKK